MLLDDAATGEGGIRLFREPSEIIEAMSFEALGDVLRRVRNASGAGAFVAGYLAYEAGTAFVPATPRREDGRLAWFGVFERADRLTCEELRRLLPDPAAAWLGKLEPRLSRQAYLASVHRLLELISAGDLYQANYTFQADLAFAGDPLALYARLRERQRAAYGAVVATGDETIISLSPELFFSSESDRLTCRPMKGTARRGSDPLDDDAAAYLLRTDPKQRAENLMIVDLMRNDLSQVAEPGSVAVPALFTVETFPTVHQLVSTVTARKKPEVDIIDLLAALFPCGSITGAPKIRAMQVIDDLEREPRGVYTGAIGVVEANGDARFNVAIRTLRHVTGGSRVRLGLGSGVVADSDPAAEWNECLDKARFLDAGHRWFDLRETMRFEPGVGIKYRDLHLARLRSSAGELQFACDWVQLDADLDAATADLQDLAAVRLSLAADGAVSIGVDALHSIASRDVTVAFVRRSATPFDFRLRHSTSDRSHYPSPRQVEHVDELVFVDAQGYLTEGNTANVFVERAGRLLTPPASRGLALGILRQHLLSTHTAIECDLRPDDCSEGLILGSDTVGLRGARIVSAAELHLAPPTWSGQS